MSDESKKLFRAELESRFGKVWDTTELQEDFTVLGFAWGCAIVENHAGVKGTLEFTHSPRFYYSFVADRGR